MRFRCFEPGWDGGGNVHYNHLLTQLLEGLAVQLLYMYPKNALMSSRDACAQLCTAGPN